MGAWGTGVFQDDTACDIRDEFLDLIAEGRSAEEATGELVRKWGLPQFDPDAEPRFWIALAATQFRNGRLTPETRDRAIAVIDSGRDPESFIETREQAERRAILTKLKDQLLGPQRRPRTIKRREKHHTTWPIGSVRSYRLSSGRLAVFRVTDHHVDSGGCHAQVEVLGVYDRLPSAWTAAFTPGLLDHEGRWFKIYILSEEERSGRAAITDLGDSRAAKLAATLHRKARAPKWRTTIAPSGHGIERVVFDHLGLS